MFDQSQLSKSSIGGIPKLKDQELLKVTADLVQRERHVLTLVLHHLREVERRRLFSDLGYPSLFEYCVRELKYSEGQAGRRIQAMRLLKELPEIEPMIRSGSLSLTNISQAQSYFRDVQKQADQKQESGKQGGQKQTTKGNSVEDRKGRNPPLSRASKLEILRSLENSSSREGQKKLIEIENEKGHLGNSAMLPKDRERPIGQDYNQVCFAMSPELKEQLEIARSLLGTAGAQMNLNDLFLEVTRIAVRELEGKKFGKKRTQKKYQEREESQDRDSTPIKDESSTSRCHCEEGYNPKPRDHKFPEAPCSQNLGNQGIKSGPREKLSQSSNETPAPAPELDIESSPGLGLGESPCNGLELGSSSSPEKSETQTKAVEIHSDKGKGLESDFSVNASRAKRPNSRYIPRSVQQAVWDRDGGKCVCCSSKRNLNFDHVQPIALGGESIESNLRLLCFQCNQRQAIKTFGVHSGVYLE